jgi:hypothetical protein
MSASCHPSSPPSAATIDNAIMPHSMGGRIARVLAMLKGKQVEMPRRKHNNLSE